MILTPRLASTVLLVFGAIALAFVVLFGLLFPLLGAVFLILGVAPQGEDPMAVGVTLIAAGLITAVIYAIPALASLVGGYGLRSERSWGKTAAIVAAITDLWLLPPFGAAASVVVLLAVLSPPARDDPS